jgi:acetyl esterase/lipase
MRSTLARRAAALALLLALLGTACSHGSPETFPTPSIQTRTPRFRYSNRPRRSPRQGHQSGGNSVAQASADQGCPSDYPYGSPTHKDVTFKTFTGKDGTTTPIKLDEYDPQSASGSVGAVVVLHGGGWDRGCKSLLNQEAEYFAQNGLLVFAADYRLSCTGNENPPLTAEERPLCGWTYSENDPATGTPGAAIHDVEDAVAWVRAHGSGYHAFNGNVAVVGGSAGGTLALSAAGANLSSGDDRKADVAGSWSALTEFGKTSDGTYSCDGAEGGGGAASVCWKAVAQYIGCDIRSDSSSSCAADYAAASPADSYSKGGAPAFISQSTMELVYIKDGEDMESKLKGLGISVDLCETPGNLHGRGITFYKACGVEGKAPPGTPTVIDSTLSFFQKYIS